MERNRCLAYATEIGNFTECKLRHKNQVYSQGQKGRIGPVSGNETFFGLMYIDVGNCTVVLKLINVDASL